MDNSDSNYSDSRRKQEKATNIASYSTNTLPKTESLTCRIDKILKQ